MKKELKKLLRKEKGITLVALIITVILMLILAGVAISAVIDGDGLFRKTREATQQYENAAKDENKTISNLMNYIDIYKGVDINSINTLELNADEVLLVITNQSIVEEIKTFELEVITKGISEKDYKWVSNVPSVATINNKGIITAVSGGTTTIECKSIDGSKTYAICDVIVEEREYLYYNGKLSSFDAPFCGSQGNLRGAPYFGEEYIHMHISNEQNSSSQQDFNLITTNQIDCSQYSKLAIKYFIDVDKTTYTGEHVGILPALLVSGKSCNYYGLINPINSNCTFSYGEPDEKGYRYADMSLCNNTGYLAIRMYAGKYLSGVITQANFYIYEVFLIK